MKLAGEFEFLGTADEGEPRFDAPPPSGVVKIYHLGRDARPGKEAGPPYRCGFFRCSASDVTDAEWALIEPHMPTVKRLGRPRETGLRAVLDAILYIARTGCQWRMLPKDFPAFTTVQG
jgi:hypothetical protein